jgi:hypothetical protein
MNRKKICRINLIRIAMIALIIALPATRAKAGERVQLEGTIRGAGCTHFKVECKNDDNHIALEADFVLVMEDGEYYFMPNVYRSVKARHANKRVRVHGERRRQEIWVDALVDLNPDKKKKTRSKSTWDWWADDDFWRSK